MTTTTNEKGGARRPRPTRQSASGSSLPDRDLVAVAVINGERIESLRREMAELAETRREAVAELLSRGHSLAEVAAELGVSRSRIQRLGGRL